MNKHLKLFANHSAYSQAESNLDKPNVIMCQQENEIHYNKMEPKLVIYYDIQDISSSTQLYTPYDSTVNSIEVDGELLDYVVPPSYQFSSTGEHVVKYEFKDPAVVGNNSPLFYNLSICKRAILPDTCTSIGNNVFRESGFTNVTLSNNITTIGNYAFYGNKITELILPASVTSIGDSAFLGNKITELTIPNTVTSIGNGAFQNCLIKRLNYNAPIPLNNSFISNPVESVIIGDSVPSITSSAFDRCYSLTNLVIGNNVTSIGSTAFVLCGLTGHLNIPNSVTSIGSSAFNSCTLLTSVTIGTGITEIEGMAFSNCSGLTGMTINATTPPTLGSSVFANTNFPIYVPAGSVEAYKTAWSAYADRIQAIS